MPKKKMCRQRGKQQIHLFHNEKPFDWQQCYCKRFRYAELKQIATDNLIKEKGESIESV
jgi:hypothetical protein